MERNKQEMDVTIECVDKETLKKVLNFIKDAIEPVAHEESKEEDTDKEPEAFRPKKGDICTYIEDDEPMAIFRHNGKERIDEDGCRMLDGDLSLGFSGNILQPYIVVKGDDQECPADECRLATEEEINLFQAFVEMYEKNEKDAVYFPKKGESYWTASFDYEEGLFEPVKTTWKGASVEYYANKRGWTFRDKEGCQSLCDKLNEAIKNVQP